MATVPDIEIDEELKKAIATLNKSIDDGDELTADFLKMIRRALYYDKGGIDDKWEEFKQLKREGKL